MRLPVHCTGVGKAIMAYLKPEETREIIARKGLPRYTCNTLTDQAALEGELSKVRRQGYAVDNQEIMDSLKFVAAPIRNQSGKVVSAISISGPISRIQGEHFERAIDLVTRTATTISAKLGYRTDTRERLNCSENEVPTR